MFASGMDRIRRVEEVFRWRTDCVSEPCGGFRTCRADQHLFKVLPEYDVVGNKVYDQCAVVGSSGVLLNLLQGKEIDRHDMVLRFNGAPVKARARVTDWRQASPWGSCYSGGCFPLPSRFYDRR